MQCQRLMDARFDKFQLMDEDKNDITLATINGFFNLEIAGK